MTPRPLLISAALALSMLGSAAPASAGPRPATGAHTDDAGEAGDPGDAGDDLPRDADPPGDLAHVDDFVHGHAPAGGPAIGATLAAAYAAAGLDRDPGTSWIRRARLTGLVPWLTVRTTRDTSWQDAQSEVGHATTLELRATWRLDRLLFDSHELPVASLASARHRERRRLASRVIRAYFTWRRAADAAGRADDDRTALRLAETIAELDALTEGWFSDELMGPARRTGHANRRRSASP